MNLIELEIVLKFATNKYDEYFSIDLENFVNGKSSLTNTVELKKYLKICNKIEADMKQIIESNYPN